MFALLAITYENRGDTPRLACCLDASMPSLSATYVSERVLPMSPVCTPTLPYRSRLNGAATKRVIASILLMRSHGRGRHGSLRLPHIIVHFELDTAHIRSILA